MDERHEEQLRRQAIGRLLRGQRPGVVARGVGRSRQWLHKWWQRFARHGWAGLASQSRQAHHVCCRYGPPVRRLVIRVRRSLERAPVGLLGPDTIGHKLKAWRLRPRPSRTTIARILQRAGLSRGSVTPPRPQIYYPHPRPTAQFRLHALDWTCRYLPGGRKVFAFHTLDYASRDLHHQLFGDKTQHSACAHLLSAWRGPLGLPDGLQLDNDIAFVGGHRVRRVFSRFVRLCLAVGVEPIFLPFREPQRNELVEELNGLWQAALWQRGRWRSLPQAQQSQPQFRHWYRHEYFPPALDGLTPARASRRQPVVRLSSQQAHDLPDPLPITAGRVHFIRRVDGHGEILILNERWRVGRRWAGQYVWATVSTQRQRLAVYWRRSAHHKVKQIKSWSYRLPKPIRPLRPEFRRRRRRRKMSTML